MTPASSIERPGVAPTLAMMPRAVASGASQVARLALPLLFLPSITRQMLPAETGVYPTDMQLAAWFALPAEFGATLYLFEVLSKSGPRRMKLLFWTDYTARLGLYAAFSAVVLLVAWALGANAAMVLMMLLGGWLVGSGLSVLRQFSGPLPLLIACDAATIFAYAAGMIVVFPRQPTAGVALGCFVASLLVGHLAQIAIERPGWPSGFGKVFDRLRWHVRRRWRLLTMRTLGQAQSQAAVPLAAVLVGRGEAGVYGVAERLFAVFANLALIGVAALSPLLARLYSRAPRRRFWIWATLAGAVTGGFGLVFGFAAFDASAICRVLFGPAYAGAASYFGLLAVIYTLSTFNGLCLGGYLSLTGKGQGLFLATLVVTGLTVALSVGLAAHGVRGILTARLTAESLLAASGLWAAWSSRTAAGR
ncbi:lipopolysaccharide biosynthesis protein [Phenylobacterium sp.]|uniref:lipopolysaccharide biosynthesis protein n=1 Tax=Phenylobacterium sp. TaxID=1871053 RepID=UPI003567C4C9